MKPIVKEGETFVTNILMQRLSPDLCYHDQEHTKYVADSTFEIGNVYGITNDEMEIVLIAAWFHDSGMA